MAKFNPTIRIEKDLGQQIYDALQGAVVESILKIVKDGSDDEYWRSLMEGHCMKVEKEILPEFHALCHEVKAKLGFTEQVDFYVTGDSTINAFSVAAEGEGQPHIVNINSGLFDLMSQDELRFVIGHELGHIINKDTALKRLINFVYPPDRTLMPITLQHKIKLHDQLAELVADRYGYLACENLNTCVTAFFKMASGLDLGKMNVSIEALLDDNMKRLDYFLHDKGVNQYGHPVNPIRVQAINLFATCKSKKILDEGMDELIGILLKIGNSPIDEDMAVFIATAGLMVSSIDGEVTEKEMEHIIQSLSNLQIFPKLFLDSILESDVEALFKQSAESILSQDPSLRSPMLAYIISLVITDKDISPQEITFIYSFGEGLGLSHKEISVMFASLIQEQYTPSLESIS
ncbi:MAG: M48 family metalloprotease [Bacteroidaceae bacterium]|nr:M48 family metalloprotease [Bacteroidaceae bacterium]